MKELGQLNYRNRFIAILSISLTTEKMVSDEGKKSAKLTNKETEISDHQTCRQEQEDKKDKKNTNLKNMESGGLSN
jgi:hypothetical protein